MPVIRRETCEFRQYKDPLYFFHSLPGAFINIPRLLSCVLPVAFLLPGVRADLAAQSFDSPLIPGGKALFQVDGRTLVFDAFFGPRVPGEGPMDEVIPLGFGSELLGTDLRARMGPGPVVGESFFRDALGDPDYRFTLGVGRGVTRVNEAHLPFHIGYGVTDRVTVRAMVPVIRRTIESAFGIDPTGANVGLNPVLGDVGAVNSFMNQFAAGLEATRAEVNQTCAAQGPGSTECQAGQAFVSDVETFFGAIDGAYGTSPAFPTPQSDAGGTLLARVADIQQGMTAWGVTSFTGAPPLASEPVDAERFAGLFVAPGAGPQLDLFFGPTEELWEIGDIELSAAFLFLDLETASEEGERPGLRYRNSLGATLRLGTSPVDTLANLIGPESQRGRTDLELQHFNDFSFGSRLGLRVDLRYGIPLSTELERFYTPRDALLDVDRIRQPVLWNPAAYQSLEVVPRVLLTPEIAFGFRYHFLMRGQEEYAFPGEPPPPHSGDPAQGAVDSRLHRVGGSLVYSTLEAAREGRTRLPYEVRARYDVAVAGRGVVPKTRGFEASVKFFLF